MTSPVPLCPCVLLLLGHQASLVSVCEGQCCLLSSHSLAARQRMHACFHFLLCFCRQVTASCTHVPVFFLHRTVVRESCGWLRSPHFLSVAAAYGPLGNHTRSPSDGCVSSLWPFQGMLQGSAPCRSLPVLQGVSGIDSWRWNHWVKGYVLLEYGWIFPNCLALRRCPQRRKGLL